MLQNPQMLMRERKILVFHIAKLGKSCEFEVE